LIFIKTMHLQLNSMLFLYHFTLYIYVYFFKVTGSIVLIDHWYLIIVWNQSKDGPQCLIALDNVAEGYGHWKDESSAIESSPTPRPVLVSAGQTEWTDAGDPGEAPADGRTEPGWSPGGRTDGTRVKPGRTDGRSPGEARTDGWTEPGWSPRGRTPEPGWSSDGGRTFWGLVNRLRCWFGWMMETDWIGCWIRIDPLGWFLWFFWFFFAVFWNKFSGGSNIDGKDLLHIRGQLRRSVIGK